MAPEAQTGYEDAALVALGLSRLDDPDYRRPTFASGTRVKLGITGFELVVATDDRKPYIAASFEFVEPEEAVGATLEERWTVNATPSNPRKPQNTGMAMTTSIICRLIAAIHDIPVKSPEVKEFFAGLSMFKDDLMGAYVPELVNRLNDLVGTQFCTDLASEASNTIIGKDAAGKPVYGKFNTLGTPVYPDPDAQRPTPKDEQKPRVWKGKITE